MMIQMENLNLLHWRQKNHLNIIRRQTNLSSITQRHFEFFENFRLPPPP
jgi:hypothetical protein